MRQNKDFDPSEYYGNIEKLKDMVEKSYTINQLRYGLHCHKCKRNGKTMYVLASKSGSEMDLFFEHRGGGKWKATEDCRKMVFASELNFEPAVYLKDLLEELTIGATIKVDQRKGLERLLDALNSKLL